MHNALLLPASLLLMISSFVAPTVAKYGGVTLDLDGTIHCPMHAKITSFCAGDSNSTDFIIYCHDGVGHLSACSIDLAVSVKPEGVKYGASCYEKSKTSGAAVCSFDGEDYDLRDDGSWRDRTGGASASSTTVKEKGGKTEPTGTPKKVGGDDDDGDGDVGKYVLEGLGITGLP